MSDRDSLFTSGFWRELLKLQGSKLQMSTAYHPQSDEQTERVNQCLEVHLRCFCNMKLHDRVRWIPWTVYWYNTSWRSSTGFNPYEIVYGRSLPTLSPYIPGAAKVQEMENVLYDHDHVLRLLKDHFASVQARMKFFTNKQRSERSFEVGKWVLLKMQPYQKLSVRGNTPYKLASRYYGPYLIVAKIGKVAYKFKLSDEAKIHDTFHVSQLTKYKGKEKVIGDSLSYYWETMDKETERILERRMVLRGNRAISQVLMKWKNMDELEVS